LPSLFVLRLFCGRRFFGGVVLSIRHGCGLLWLGHRGSYSVAWQASAAGIFLGAVLLGKKWKSASRDNQAEINDGSDR
jgi:hypothetical protein